MNGLGHVPRAVLDAAAKPDDFYRGRHLPIESQGDDTCGHRVGPWISRRPFGNCERKRILRRNRLDLNEQSRERQKSRDHESHRARPLTASNAASSPSPVTTPFRATASPVTIVANPRSRNTYRSHTPA